MKRLSIFFIITLLISSIFIVLPAKTSYADVDIGIAGTYDPGEDQIDNETAKKYAGPIYNFLYALSIIVTVICLTIIGLKFIIGSAQEKAEYKQHLVPVAVGVFMVSFIMSIIGTFAKIAEIF